MFGLGSGELIAIAGVIALVLALAKFGSSRNSSTQQTQSVSQEVPKILSAFAILAAMGLLGFNYLRTGGRSPSLSLAWFRVTNQAGNDSCTSLSDYCAHVECTVYNYGYLGGTGQVQIELQQGGRTPLMYAQPLSLNAGESGRVTHDFPEADLFDANPVFRCSAY